MGKKEVILWPYHDLCVIHCNVYTLHSSREAPPVGKHHERQTFTVEVANGLSCFEG